MMFEDHLWRLQASSVAHNGCAAWNQWRRDVPQMKLDLSGADLHKADLNEADLSRVDLREADLGGADLSKADLSDANLRSAILSGALLRAADLREADLSEADLRGADLSDAKIGWTNFATLDLRQVIGLATCHHLGPSSVATDVLYQSRGEIPDSFLRGCGVPDAMITCVRSIASTTPIADAFLSYNHEDELFATRLYTDLQANDVRCWKYPEDIQAGKDILRHVEHAIRFHQKLIVIFSEHAVASEWAAAEIEHALASEQQEQQQILFPVTLDAAVHETPLRWAAMIRQSRTDSDLAISDFTSWGDQDEYQRQFAQFLHDVKV